MIESRGMSKEQPAAYAGCETLSAFNDWIRRGIMPMSRTRVPSNLLREDCTLAPIQHGPT
jgi:hypothetical protein